MRGEAVRAVRQAARIARPAGGTSECGKGVRTMRRGGGGGTRAWAAGAGAATAEGGAANAWAGAAMVEAGAANAEAGAATAEFTLVAGLLILLTFAAVELGVLLHVKLVLAQAARTGLRQAIVDGGESPRAIRVIEDQLRAGGMDPARAAITISPRTAHYGTIIRVTVSDRYTARTPLLRWLRIGDVRLGATLLGRSEFLGGGAP